MLDELHVSNLGIISDARIEPGPGLVAVTGETGAGKTLLLGALRLLRGDTARTDRVGPHGDEAVVEGRFLVDDGELVVARRVGDSRSRAYVDGSMVPVRALAERLRGHVEIVAQHEHVALARDARVRELVDSLLDDRGAALLGAYREVYDELSALEDEAQSLVGDPRELARELDLLTHQAGEIESAAVTTDEDAELVGTLQRLRHAGEIAQLLARAHDGLASDGQAIDLLRDALDDLRAASKLDDALARLSHDLESTIAASEELAAALRQSVEGIDHDPRSLAVAEARAAVVADLKRKYGATIHEVLAFGETATRRAQRLREMLDRADTISGEIAAVRARVLETGAELSEARRGAAQALADTAVELLKSLGFRSPILRCEFDEVAATRSGTDRITLSFSSDDGLRPGPVSRVASGGELSRLVLSVRVAAGIADAPVVAFDEVDAGVGGATALAMGEHLAGLARSSQVLIVTHLPQVAAFADSHFVVEREGSVATVRRVEGEERVRELARMLSGLEESEGGRLHAEELLELATTRRGT